jgi:hypothetical protein
MVDIAVRAHADVMDAVTAVGPSRFGFTKPPLGKGKGALTVGPSTVTLEPPTFKQPVEVPIANLILVPLDGAAIGVPLLKRNPKLVRVGVTQYTEANLALVFRQPVPFGRSKWGSQQLTGIKARERRTGLLVDVVTLSLADPERAIAELRSHGAGEAPTLSDALAGVIGVPQGLELEERKQSVAKARKRAYRGLVAWGLVVAITVPLRFAASSGLPAARLWHIGGLAMAWAALSSLVTLSMTGHRRDPSAPSAPRPKRSARKRLIMTLAGTFGAIGALAGAFALAASLSGSSETVALGAVGGVPAGVILGVVWRIASAIRNAPDPVVHLGASSGLGTFSPPPPITSSEPTWVGGPIEPLEAKPRPRLRRTLGIGLAAIVGLLVVLLLIGLIVEALDHAPDDGLAGTATITAAELPGGWTAYSGAGPDGRAVRDEHICGNEPGTLPDHTGGYGRELGYKRVNGTELAHLDVGVLISPTAASAKREFAVALANGPAYRSCVVARAVQLAAVGSPKATGDPVTSIDRSTIGAIPGVVDRITVTTPTVRGTRVTHIAFVRLRIDRVIVRMPVTTWGRPMSDAQLLPIIKAEQEKVEAALA